MRRGRRALAGALCVGLLLTVAAASHALARADAWQGCGSPTVTSAAGAKYRIAPLEATGTDCAEAEAVVRGFYSQTIGSSGATVAEGLGCAYESDGASVLCRSSSGSAYDGPVGVRWSEHPIAPRRARAASCGPFTVANGRSSLGPYELLASGVRRSPYIPCGRVRKLIKATYGVGPMEVVRTVYPDVGRPTYWLRGGWRCGNGAGGAACWNAEHSGLNAIPLEGLSHGLAVTASTRVVSR